MKAKVITEIKESINDIKSRIDSIEKSLNIEIQKQEGDKFISNHLKYIKDYTGKEVFAIPEKAFLELVEKGIHTKIPVGTLIQLDNEYCDLYEVIGINHDGCEGTIDVMAHYQVMAMQFDKEDNYYEDSCLCNWLNNKFIKKFNDDIYGKLSYMKIATNNEVLCQKVKILSVKELGYEYDNYFDKNEYDNPCNNKYEAFNSTGKYEDDNSKWRNTNNGVGDGWGIWTRSRHTSSTTYVWLVISDGTCGTYNLTDSRGVLPVLRF